MIKFPQLFKQQINYIEKASKEHDGAFWNSKSVKPLRRKMILCFEALDSDHVSWIIWFRSRLQSIYRESFDIDRDVRAASRDVFIPTGNKSNSAEAGVNKPEGGNPPNPPPPPPQISTNINYIIPFGYQYKINITHAVLLIWMAADNQTTALLFVWHCLIQIMDWCIIQTQTMQTNGKLIRILWSLLLLLTQGSE